MCQNCNLSICYGMRQFLNFVIPGPSPAQALHGPRRAANYFQSAKNIKKMG
jgi:hypothetical protein